MRDPIFLCFLLSIVMSFMGAITAPGDYAPPIFGLMFWCTGWVIAIGRVRYGS